MATTDRSSDLAARFRELHQRGRPLVLANAWDAGSARIAEQSGAAAVATTSAGLAWSRGYPDGDAIPVDVLATAVREISRVISVPLTVDIESGYAPDPEGVGLTVSSVIAAGGVGINIEDGSAPPSDLAAKIAAARKAALAAGVELFINARTDVYLRGLAGPESAIGETISRARQYRDAGADGIFVPGVADPEAIRELASGIELPLNVMVVPGLPPVSQLAELGVSRVSAGADIAMAAFSLASKQMTTLLRDGTYDAPGEGLSYAELNALFPRGD